jgi:hypothetical protein
MSPSQWPPEGRRHLSSAPPLSPKYREIGEQPVVIAQAAALEPSAQGA